MYSWQHFLLGAAASAATVAYLWGDRGIGFLVALATYGVLLSVFIDLDHFVIAWLNAGTWEPFRAAVLDPIRAFTDQEWVFSDVPDMTLERLLSHMLIGGALSVASLAAVGPAAAVYTALVVYVHVVGDLAFDAELI